MLGATVPPERASIMADLQDRLDKVLAEAMPWESVRPDYVRIYVETFSEEQLDAMITFYKSSAGQAMVAKMPVLMAKGAEIGQRRLADVAPRIRKLIEEFAAQAAHDQ
jgi:hypothetical protein